MLATDVHVTTTFEQVGGPNILAQQKYFWEDKKAASTVMRLCEPVGIFGSNRVVVANSWFANLSLAQDLRKNGLHLLGMIKQGDEGYPKVGLCKKLEKREGRVHAVATTTIEGNKYMKVAWREKSDWLNKSKGKKILCLQIF